MSFQPATSIKIGVVPFNIMNGHIRYFPNKQQQESYFLSICNTSLSRDDYTYQRMNNSVVVPFNAEAMYGYNYCMFKNKNYGDKWFYSFISEIEYVGENQCRLYLALDIMQTWFLDCEIPPCMVEREHVNDDRIGLNVKNEAINPGSQKCVSTYKDYELQWCTVVSSVVEPSPDGYINVRGDVYGHIYSGASRSVFITAGGHDGLKDFQDFMLGLSNNGQQDAVSNAWMVPEWMAYNGGETRIYDKDGGFGYWLKNGINSLDGKQDLNVPINFNSCDGYVPKNNKLFTYPFSKIVMVTSTGQQELACEYFANVKGKNKGESSTIQFTKLCTWEADGTPMIYPLDYNGTGLDGYEYAVTLPSYPTVTWVFQTFANMYSGGYGDKLKASVGNTQENFSTQNTNNNYGTMAGMATGAASGAAMGAGLGSIVPGLGTGVGAAIGAALGAGTSLIAGQNTHDSLAQSRENSMRSAKADLTAAGLSPNTVKGSLSSSAQSVNSSQYGVWIRLYRPRAEMAKIVDDFFSMYGYTVSELKHPNITGRQSWNYIKTNGANARGKVPQDVLANINTILDGGVTFWHTDDVGNYSQSNGIVG